jgi:hypothetical protein
VNLNSLNLDTLSERLKWIRDRYFKTQKAMAAAMDCNESYITALLKPGDHELGRSMVVKLFEAMLAIDSSRVNRDGVDPGWIMFGARQIAHPHELTESTPPYRVTPKMNLALLFRSESTDQLIGKLAGVLSEPGAAPSDRVATAELLLEEIKKRLLSSAESQAEADARSLDAEHDQATEDLMRSKQKREAGGPSERKPRRPQDA